MTEAEPFDRRAVHDELDRARADFHRLLDYADADDLRRPSRGTRWSNEQLLFHMLFGYVIVRALPVLARLFARLPVGVNRGFARLLNAATGPFDTVNYLGSCLGAKVYNHRRMGAKCDRVIAALQGSLAAEPETELERGMSYPVRWDPFFREFMTRADLYHYATQHFDFHREQLTLGERPV